MAANRYTKLLLALAFALSMAGVKAQLPDHHLQLIDYLAGIRPGNIIAVTRDHKGFLWILYPRSIQRFDGRASSSFKITGDMRYVHSDEHGRVWASSSRKVFRFDDESRNFVEVRVDGMASDATTGMVFNMPDKRTWLLTSGGFYEYNANADVFKKISYQLPIPPPYNSRAFGAYAWTIFFGHERQVFRYNIQSKKLDSLPEKEIMRIFPVNEDSVVFTSWNSHSYWYNFNARTINEAQPPQALRIKQPGTAFTIRGFCRVGPERFLVPSSEGFFEYDLRKQQFRLLQLYHKGIAISTADFANYIYYDRDGYVWLSTIDGIGRFPLHGQSFGLVRIRQLKHELPVGIDNIRNIAEDNEGNLWLATGSGFVCWKRQQNEWKFYAPEEGSKNKLAFPSVRGIAFDGRYVILAPANTGIRLFEPATQTYRLPSFASPAVKERSEQDFFDATTTLRNGNHLLLGRDALYLLNGKTYTLSFVENPAAHENTNFALQGKDGMIWLATQRGLHLLDSNLSYRQKIGLPGTNPYISAGYILPDGRLLFGLEGGLFTATRTNGTVVVKKLTNLLDKIFINALCQDDNGFIWIMSENGIYRFDPRNQKLNLFDHSDNVQGYGFNTNSWHRTRDGILFIGGINGLNYIRPGQLSTATDPLQVFIEEVRGGGNDTTIYSTAKKAILSYAQRSLEVEFVSPYYNNPEKLKYRYRLQGLDGNWNYTGNDNAVHFTSLPAGDYKLLVEASINNVDWVRAQNSFSFRIKPPFWLTWWFITFSILLLALLVYLVIRNRNKKIRQKNEELETEQAINYFSSSMYRHQSVDDILWDVARNCIGRLHFEDCVIYLVDETKNKLIQKAAYGPKNTGRYEIAQPIEIPVGQGITGSVAATGKAELIHDTSKDPRYIVDDKRRYSEIAVPIVADSKVLGVIDCEHSKKRFFTQKHLSILTTIASLCASKLIKTKAENEKQEAERILMDTKQKMADAEMQALRAQMNPHFIFNCLNSINRYIVKSDQATASLYLTRFAKLIRLILDNSNSKTVTLSNELEALRLYIEMESIRFEKQFSYAITIDESVQPDSIYVPPLIMQPYVENAIWHGLLHKEEAGKLSIDICCATGSVLHCTIADNGIGRDKARELKSKSTATKKSLGMKLTEDRLKLLNQQSNMDASVQVIDLKTASGEVAGTKVILKIPVDG